MMIYVHVPFCVKKCGYCDFFSGAFGAAEEAAYFESLKQEIEENPFAFTGERVSSVFFGGGTPSFVHSDRIGEILALIRRAFSVDADAEITLEMNPGTVTGSYGNETAAEKLLAYRKMGVNRLSIGLQSAENRLLQKIGRVHTFETFLEAFSAARSAGFSNLNVDLISGLPTDTPDAYENGLRRVLSLNPEHLSVYSLIIAENTPFYALYGENGTACAELPSEEDEREMYYRTCAVLNAHGYRQYEISNFSLPGKECRHNVGYWTHVPYLGFGAAAASFVPGENGTFLRYKNPERLDYISGPYEETERLLRPEQMAEYMLLGFRMTDGISCAAFREKFSEDVQDVFGKTLEKLGKEGLIETADPAGDRRWRLTKKGLDLANRVFSEFV